MQWVIGSSLALLCSVAIVMFKFVSRSTPHVRQTTKFEVVRLPGSGFRLLKDGQPFIIKGVCYSPMEINSNINDAPVAPDDTHPGKVKVTGSMFGDSFWDPPNNLEPFQAALMQNWFGLWGSGSLTKEHYARGDLAKISHDLNANAIRVYFMQSRLYEETAHKVPKAPQLCQKRTHRHFLDEAARNGLYILVGLPLPIQLFHIDDYQKCNPKLIEWWEFVLAETVAEIGHHPAVLGFTVMNELDDEPNAFPGQGSHSKPTHKSDFWHNQVVKYASAVKSAAPGKLVGWALHDCPSWVGFAANATPTTSTEYLSSDATYLKQISSVFDYYGVNTYQSKSFMSVLGTWGDHGEIGSGGKAYGAPSIAADMKPVILTEIGWPATARVNMSDVKSDLKDDETTQTAVAGLIDNMFPQIYDEFSNVTIGAFYFEYTDEWWKTPKPLAAVKELAGPWHQDGGDDCSNFGFPNQCNDEEAFGLYTRARSGDRDVNSSNFGEFGITLPVDKLSPRLPMVGALAAIYGSNLTEPRQLNLTGAISLAAVPRSPRAASTTMVTVFCLVVVGTFALVAALKQSDSRASGEPSSIRQPFLQVL